MSAKRMMSKIAVGRVGFTCTHANRWYIHIRQSCRDQLVKYRRFSSFRMDLDNEAYSIFTALSNINTTSSIVFIAHKNYTKRVCRLTLFLSMDIKLFRNRKCIEHFWLRYMPFINQTLTIVETSPYLIFLFT